ncbi:response regulator [Streptomyces smyrnaeus]|uniref:response regulator n=1 Tax=Streptomyces TaxID=1883 RepID=UPI000C19FAEA|nr:MULTISPECIES: response regulator [unclassified Streptomyces]MBQ0863825.1 response regulator [Streptomyces sp. RK75]MBQ1122154.1 response regulator [Streptomyces sp. B15]
MTRVLVVDDDFHVAEINSAYVAKTPGFRVVGQAGSCAEALAAVDRGGIDLVLLDHYLPDRTGVELARELQRPEYAVDVIMVTAAQDVETVRSAVRCGALHYVVKPFTYQTLRTKLDAYARLQKTLAQDVLEGQASVDGVFQALRSSTANAPSGKGYAMPTVQLVHQVIARSRRPLSAHDVAERTGISRSTAQRYLKHLESSGRLKLVLKYGESGRPVHLYE